MARPRRMRSFSGLVWVCGGRAPLAGSAMSKSWHEAQQVVDRVRFFYRLVSANAVDARESHGLARLVPGRAGDAVASDLPLQFRGDLAHRAKAVGRVVAHPFVEPTQLLVGEAEIGLPDRRQLLLAFDLAPAAERIVRIEGAALAVA